MTESFIYETPFLSAAATAGASLSTPDHAVTVLHRWERPTVAVLVDVLLPEECAALIELARPHLVEATVVDPATGALRLDPHRRCAMHHLRRDENPQIERIERRLASLMGAPVEHGEGLQVLRYLPGGEYVPHHDYFDPQHYDPQAPHLRIAGQRTATLLMYLNDAGVAGGETFFPQLGIRIPPYCGGAVYFEYTNSLGQLDAKTLHGGAPVLQGEKWIATKWMRQRPWPQTPL